MVNTPIRTFLVVFTLALFSPVFLAKAGVASELPVKASNICIENGLSHNNVTDIYRDEYGMLWIATKDGLNRYDGHQVVKIIPGNSDIPTNIISSLRGDGEGHVFVKGKNNLFIYDIIKEKFSVISEDKVVAIEYSDHLYWAGSRDIYRYDAATGSSVLQMKLDERFGDITDFCCDINGTLFIATSDSHILKNDRDNNVSIIPVPQLSGVQADDAGNVWAFTLHSDLICFSPDGTSRSYPFTDSDRIEAVAHLKDSKYLIGTSGGLFLLDISTSEIMRITCRNTPDDSVNCLLFDGTGFFVGTTHSGLFFMTSLPDFVNSDQSGDISSIINGMASPVSGSIWLATKNGLSIINLTHVPFEQRILFEERLKSEILDMCFDRKNGLCWMATASGWVCCAVPSRNEVKWTRTDEFLHKVKADPDGNLLANTGHSIISIDRNSLRTSVLSEGEFIDFVMDDLGFLWTSTASTIIQADTKHPSNYRRWHYSQIFGMKGSNTITTLYKDDDGKLWLGTDGSGLFQYDSSEDKYIHYGLSDGLENEYINDISYNNHTRQLLLATNGGLSMMGADNTFVNLSPVTGFPMHQVNIVCPSLNGESVGLFGGKETKVLKRSELVPALENISFRIKSVHVNNCQLCPADLGPLYESALVQKHLSLDWRTHSVSFDVYNTSLNPIMENRFKYKLDGFDHDYKEAGSSIITYTNLNSGKYLLHVSNMLNDGDSDTFSLEIRTPFWKAPWFLAGMALLLLLIAGFSIKVFLRIEKMKTSLVLEQKDAEHQRMVSQVKTAFASNITHEFRTPLSLIGNYLEMLMKEPDISSEAMRNVMSAYKNTEQLYRLVDEFIDINRDEVGFFSLNLAPTELDTVLSNAYSYYEDYARSKDINYSFENDGSGLMVMVDAEQIERAVVNLLSNAFKFASRQITLSLHEDDTDILIDVSDDGPGIEESNIEHIFERYWTDSSRCRESGQSSGSGIGLSFVERVVKMHGGTITVQSRPGDTVFTIKFPNQRIVSPDSEILHEQSVGKQASKDYVVSFTDQLPQDRSFVILIVEDNVEMMDVLSKTFSERFSVIKAFDGQSGFEQARKEQPDLIISDVIMPKMYGTTMCSKIKNDSLTCHIPVILLTALDSEDKVLTGIASGADDYITKPFKTSVLIAKVINILKSRILLQEIYAHDASKTEESLSENPLDIKFLKDAVSLVEKNMTVERFDVDSFAEGLCVSRAVLFRKIKALTGMSPNNFILSIKLKKAAAAICANPSLNIEEVSLMCGFNSSSYFIKCFKKFYSQTPLAYRKSMSQKQQVSSI